MHSAFKFKPYERAFVTFEILLSTSIPKVEHEDVIIMDDIYTSSHSRFLILWMSEFDINSPHSLSSHSNEFIQIEALGRNDLYRHIPTLSYDEIKAIVSR